MNASQVKLLTYPQRCYKIHRRSLNTVHWRRSKMGFVVVAVIALLVWGIWAGWLLAFAIAALAMASGVFAFGTLGFWLLMLVASGLIFMDLDDDSGAVATITTLVVLLLLQFFGDVKVFSYVWNHPGMTALYALGYAVLGGAWSCFKWNSLVKDNVERLKDYKALFFKQKELELTTDPSVPDRYKSEFLEGVSRRNLNKPDPTYYKSKILTWLTYWPWSVLWYLINDFVKRVFREIYRLLKNVYRRISDYHYKNFEEDLKPNNVRTIGKERGP